METKLSEAWTDLIDDMLGATGSAGDGAIMAAQLVRAAGVLTQPAIAPGSLFEIEPSTHASVLARLAAGSRS